jgi:hypothetical protein
LHDVPDVATLGFQCVADARQPRRLLRGELTIDTSRFAAGTGLPRGPPICSAAS